MPGAERPIGPRAATALLLVEGYCALAVEMIALRALVPVAGQSVAVTSLVVTAFLAALALGYRAGGGFEGDAREKVARNLAGAAAWSAFWLSRLGVALAFEATGGLPPLAQVAVYAMVGVGPVAYLLAQAVVLLVGSAGPETAPGKAGARVRREHPRQRRGRACDRARGDAARGRRGRGGAGGGAPGGGGARGVGAARLAALGRGRRGRRRRRREPRGGTRRLRPHHRTCGLRDRGGRGRRPHASRQRAEREPRGRRRDRPSLRRVDRGPGVRERAPAGAPGPGCW